MSLARRARLFRRLPLQLPPRRSINQTEAAPQSPRLSSHDLRILWMELLLHGCGGKGDVLGAIGAKNIQDSIKRMLENLKPMNFNCLELTRIVAKRFLGVPYAVVSAHSRHIQQSCYPDGADDRRTSRRDAEEARA